MVITPRRSLYARDKNSEADKEKDQVEPQEPETESAQGGDGGGDGGTVHITGQWSSPEDGSDAYQYESTDTDQEEESKPEVPKADFVRVVHGQVGMYPRGSVLPVSTFEYLQNLLDLGAVEYDYSATVKSVTGNPEHLATITNMARASMQILPSAPWITAAAHNLLGAYYTPLSEVLRPYGSPPATQMITIGPEESVNAH